MSVLATLSYNDPKTFLENVLKTPYPCTEKNMDRINFAAFFCANVFIYSFLHPFLHILQCVHWITNERWGALRNTTRLTPGISPVVLGSFATSDERTDALTKLKTIDEKTHHLARKMGLSNVELYLDLSPLDLEQVCCARTFNTRLIVMQREILFDFAPEELDYLLAHELTHLKKYHPFLLHAFSWLVFSIKLLILRFFSRKYVVPLIMLTQGIASFFHRAMLKKFERDADKNAMIVNNSNTGMLKYNLRRLIHHYRIKHFLTYEEFQRSCPDASPQKFSKLKNGITPFGNNRMDFFHPPLTESITMALAFTPKPTT
jgi:Zn-dependent protease with chaperone function